MRTLLLSVGKQLSTSPSVVKTLAEYWGHVQREAWQSLRHNLRFDSLWGRFPSKKSRSFEVTIHSHTDAIESTVSYFQHRIVQYFRKSDALIGNLGLCLRESLANAIIHGNLEISPKLRDECWEEFEKLLQERQNRSAFARRQVVIRCEMKPQSVKFDVEDQGAGFNAEKVSARLQHKVFAVDAANLGDLSAGGRGLVIITTFMDHVFWNPKGNHITMVKHIPASK